MKSCLRAVQLIVGNIIDYLVHQSGLQLETVLLLERGD